MRLGGQKPGYFAQIRSIGRHRVGRCAPLRAHHVQERLDQRLVSGIRGRALRARHLFDFGVTDRLGHLVWLRLEEIGEHEHRAVEQPDKNTDDR